MSASAGNLSVTIVGIDKTTAVFDRISANAKRMTAPFDRLARSVRGMGDATGVNRLAAGVQRLTRVTLDATRQIGGLGLAISGIGGAVSIGAIFRVTSAWSQMSTRLGLDSQRIMSSVTQLHGLQGAARLAGASAEDMTSSLRSFGDTLSDAVGGRNQEAVQYFTLLGIRMRTANGQARTATDVLPDVADAIARIADPRLQARVLSALGISETLLPVFRRGAAGLREYRREAERYGLETKGSAEAARQFTQAQTRLTMATQGLFNSISEQLSPVLVPLMKRLTDWISNNRKLIASGIGGWVRRTAKSIEAWVNSGGLTKLFTSLENIGNGIQSVVTWLGGWGTAVKIFGAILLARLIAPLVQLVGLFGTIAAFRPPAWLLRALPLAFTGAAGGEDPDFSRQRNEEWLRDHPRDPNTPAPTRPEEPVLNRWFNGVRRQIERAFSPRGGDRSVQGMSGPAQRPSQSDAEFAATWGPAAQRVAAERGVPVSWVLAHWSVESHNGRSFAGQNNPANMTGLAGESTTSGGDTDGRGNPIRQNFLNFSSPEAMADRYSRWIGNRAPNAVGARTPQEYFRELQRGGYATSPNFVSGNAGAVGRFEGLPTAPAVAATSPATPPSPAGGSAPRAQVDITLRGAPPGTTVDARPGASGVDTSVRIERAMPGTAP